MKRILVRSGDIIAGLFENITESTAFIERIDSVAGFKVIALAYTGPWFEMAPGLWQNVTVYRVEGQVMSELGVPKSVYRDISVGWRADLLDVPDGKKIVPVSPLFTGGPERVN